MGEHLDRTIGWMADADVDVLLLGREANTRWVTGANRLWLAGTRPFAPGCVVVRSPRSVHMLSVTDDGLGGLVPPEHLYPITWNPMNMLGAVAAVPGVAEARRVGVDCMSPLFEQLIAGVLPGKELVDAEALLRDARHAKTADDIVDLRAAAAVASDAVRGALDAYRPGSTADELKGVVAERMCAHGVTTPALEAQVTIGGGRVTIRGGVERDGWEAVLARTHPAAPAAEAALDTLLATWTTHTTAGDLRRAGAVVEGVGVGHEELFDDDGLEPATVAYVEVRTDDGTLHGDTVLFTADGPEPLTI